MKEANQKIWNSAVTRYIGNFVGWNNGLDSAHLYSDLVSANLYSEMGDSN
jgi:hypothetical protein